MLSQHIEESDRAASWLCSYSIILTHLLTNPDFHLPKIAGRQLAVLLYGDEAAILSKTPIGLRRGFRKMETCCEENHLTINYDKTKIMAFGKKTAKSSSVRFTHGQLMIIESNKSHTTNIWEWCFNLITPEKLMETL